MLLLAQGLLLELPLELLRRARVRVKVRVRVRVRAKVRGSRSVPKARGGAAEVTRRRHSVALPPRRGPCTAESAWASPSQLAWLGPGLRLGAG